MINRIVGMQFSATGTTARVVRRTAKALEGRLAVPYTAYDMTLPAGRADTPALTAADFVLLGVPVYAGRVPNVLLPYLKTVRGNGAYAAAVVLYGNRDYDDALLELRDLMTADGFHVIAGAAFIGEHAFSRALAAGRPDAADLLLADRFAEGIAQLLSLDTPAHPVAVRGQTPLRPYYTPRDRRGEPVNILKVKPQVSGACTRCGLCAAMCPMGSIDPLDITAYTGICIKCGACIKGCPQHARYYDDAGYLYHQRELEEQYAARKEPALFF